jgi:hypothetical protein
VNDGDWTWCSRYDIEDIDIEDCIWTRHDTLVLIVLLVVFNVPGLVFIGLAMIGLWAENSGWKKRKISKS